MALSTAHYEKQEVLKCKNMCLSLLIKRSPWQERTQAPADSIESLCDQKKYLQGTGASTSLKSVVPPLYMVEKREPYSVRRKKGLVLPVVLLIRCNMSQGSEYEGI